MCLDLPGQKDDQYDLENNDANAKAQKTKGLNQHF